MKKIMFNDKYGLTKAVLENRKTQTRRIVPQRILDMVPAYQEEYWNGALESISVEDAIYNLTHGERRAKAPYHVGEEIAVAQPYKNFESKLPVSIYGNEFEQKQAYHIFGYNSGWHNKMFVSAYLMPHRIKITNIRIERLQDISDADCFAEGAQEALKHLPNCEPNDLVRDIFSILIDKTCGKGTWQSNPYVFVYDFKLVK